MNLDTISNPAQLDNSNLSEDVYNDIVESIGTEIITKSYNPSLNELIFDINVQKSEKIGPMPDGVFIRSISRSKEQEAMYTISINTKNVGINNIKENENENERLNAFSSIQLSLIDGVTESFATTERVQVETEGIESTEIFSSIESNIGISVDVAIISQSGIHSLVYKAVTPPTSLEQDKVEQIRVNKIKRRCYDRANEKINIFDCGEEVDLCTVVIDRSDIEQNITETVENDNLEFYKVSMDMVEDDFGQSMSFENENADAVPGYVCSSEEHVYIPVDETQLYNNLMEQMKPIVENVSVDGEKFEFIVLPIPLLPNQYVDI